jgi:sigma-E factor negative regulatory protein RseB
MSRARRGSGRLLALALACGATAGALAQTPASQTPAGSASSATNSPGNVAAKKTSLEHTPSQWLERMNQALVARNYDGTFSHWHGGHVEMLRIIHRFQDGVVSERLASLDGSGREFIRTGTTLACYLPDRRTVVVEHHAPQQSLVGFPMLTDESASLYDIREVGHTRLNHHETHIVTVAPRDEFRYGYRLWIDDATAMPLKTQLCDTRGQVIEQIVFASLRLPGHIPDSAFRPELSTAGFQWLRNDPLLPPPAAALAWNAMHLPPGFRMAVRSVQVLPGSANAVEHLVFTDGFATVSVFVERQAGAVGPPAAEAAVGSSSAFSTVIDGHKITAVGEVPPATVRFIASQVKAEAPGAAPDSPH